MRPNGGSQTVGGLAFLTVWACTKFGRSWQATEFFQGRECNAHNCSLGRWIWCPNELENEELEGKREARPETSIVSQKKSLDRQGTERWSGWRNSYADSELGWMVGEGWTGEEVKMTLRREPGWWEEGCCDMKKGSWDVSWAGGGRMTRLNVLNLRCPDTLTVRWKGAVQRRGWGYTQTQRESAAPSGVTWSLSRVRKQSRVLRLFGWGGTCELISILSRILCLWKSPQFRWTIYPKRGEESLLYTEQRWTEMMPVELLLHSRYWIK